MTAAEHIPTVSTGAVIGALVLLGVAGGGGYWMGQATTEQPPADSTDIGRKGTKGDLADGSDPDEVTTYERDTSNTRTECFEAPSWIQSQPIPEQSGVSDAETAPKSAETGRSDSVSSAPMKSPTVDSLPSVGGQTYAITPLTNGSPPLSVGHNQVEFSALLPVDGGTRMRTWTYDIERPDNRLAAFAEAGILPGTAYSMTGGQYTRDLGRLDVWGLTLDTQVHAAVAQAWTTRGVGPSFRTGVSVGVSW